jgi:enoyl-CoA hydratase/carnithine racemase
MSDELILEQQGAVLVARLNRPEARNALSPTLLGAIGAAVTQAENDVDIRALVLTGTGDRAFCSGMDLRAFAADGVGATDPELMKGFARLIEGSATIPIIGAAQATAVAGGFELLLGCDLIVASTEAKFGLPEVKRGLYAAGRGTFVGQRIPLSIALELSLTGDYIDAARAYELGLVNKVVPPDQVLTAALEYAEKIAANGPLAVKATKELVRLGVTDIPKAEERNLYWQPLVFSSEDAKEGATAYIEKRPAVWKGQ